MKINKISSINDAIDYHNAIIDCEDDKIILDFSSSSFIQNNLISILGLALEIQKNKTIKITKPKAKNIMNDLKNIGFLSKYSDGKNEIDLDHTMIQYINIQQEDTDYFRFLEFFIKQLDKRVKNLSPELKKKITQKIIELFSNVFRHSESELGFFCSGQFDPSQKKFYITIADGGVTIKTKVNKYIEKLSIKKNPNSSDNIDYDAHNGYEAIRWALIDTNSTTGSGGFGLSLLKELIMKSQGILEIVSNDGYYKIEKGEISGKVLKNEFKGTIINIGLSTSDEQYFYLDKGENQND